MNLIRCGLEPRGRIALLSDEIGIVAKIQLLRRPLRDALARQQADLRDHEVQGGLDRILPLLAVLVRHLDGGRISFQRYPRPVDWSGQKRRNDGAGKSDCQSSDDQPAPMLDDPDERGEIENMRCRVSSLAAAQIRLAGGIMTQRPRPLLRDYDIIVHDWTSPKSAAP